MKKREKSLKGLAWGAIFALFCFISIVLCVFTTFFALGGEERELVVVPSFVGMTQNDIKEDGIFDIELDFAYSDSVPEGVVISQTPSASSRRKIASSGSSCAVKLIVSLGKEREEVPCVVGMSYNAALAALRRAGFSVKIVPVYRNDMKNDTVISVTPREETSLDRGERVTLYVSRERVMKTVEVESYYGLERALACERILESGLCLRIVESEYSDEVEEGRVIAQSFPKGARLKYGSYIDLTVSAGKRPCAEDNIEAIEEEQDFKWSN